MSLLSAYPFSTFIWISLALFGSTKSASLECQFKTEGWGPFTLTYLCSVQNSVNIVSRDAVLIDTISGQHQAGFNNDKVEVVDVYQKGQIYYFPRGLTNFFKNLKGIRIESTGLKEIHQSDLKDYSKLVALWFYGNDLEVLEENLFEFNPNLEWLLVWSNKITHIDPFVFVKLIKLKTLYLISNPCINTFAENNSTAVQNVIKTAQHQCTNLDYSSLEQKVRYFEMESKNLFLKDLRGQLGNLKNEIKNSKFPNFFQEKLLAITSALITKDILSGFNDKSDAQALEIADIKKMLKQIIDAINAFKID